MLNIADIILITILLVALFIGSITDFKKREVPDWLSFSLIGAGLGIRLCYSLLTYDWSYIVNGLAGFALFLALAFAMFYAGQWGGGDSKVLMGVGAILGLNVYNFSQILNSTLIGFFINVLFVGAIFGLLFSIYLAAKNWNAFKKEFVKIITEEKMRKARMVLSIMLIVLIAGAFFYPDRFVRLALVMLAFMSLPALYLIIFIKSVEKACMMKYVKPTELTEGDWIVKDIKINGKKICGPKDLGIEKPQIAQLIKFYRQGKVKKILIKEGVPFVPSFFLALIATLVYGNWFFSMIV